MKKRMMSILLALILLLSVISPVSPCSAAEEASTEPSVQEPALEQEEEPEPDILSPVIRLQILTKPTFNKTLKAKNGRVSYEPNDDGNTVELDALGNRVGVLPDYFSLDYGLWAAYRGTNKAALALGWGQKPVTDYVYEEFFVQGDCIRAERGEGRLPDFYDFEGHPRSVGKLPAGWTPLFVTSAGTVGATKNGTAAQLFDQKGKALLDRDYYNISFETYPNCDTDQIGTKNSTVLCVFKENISWHPFLVDLYGKPFCDKMTTPHYFVLPDRVIVGRYDSGERFEYQIESFQHEKLGSFTGWIEEKYSDNAFLAKDESGYYGMVDGNGVFIVPAEFSEPRYWMDPVEGKTHYGLEATRFLRLENTERRILCNADGEIMAEYTADQTVGYSWYHYVILEPGGMRRFYDIHGKLLAEFPEERKVMLVNGILFEQVEEDYYCVIDRNGNRLSKLYYSKIPAGIGCLGLAVVTDRPDSNSTRQYVLNALGEEQCPDEIQTIIKLDALQLYGREPLLVYSKDGQQGLCRILTPDSPKFVDVTADSWYSEPVAWAVENGVTSGTSEAGFSPNASCTRGQVVTFLWRAKGSPDVILSDSEESQTDSGDASSQAPENDTANPFTDVSATAYYYKPVLWAVQNGVTSGTSATTFSPGKPCTRGQVVTFLWRAEGEPEPAADETPFTDVQMNAYYYKAVLWAVENGVTQGTSATKFSPNATCTRAQVVTFLYRACAE